MSTELTQLVTDYLRVRRALGFKLEGTQVLLTQFVAYLEERHADTVTIEHALGFATAPAGASPRWQALRLSAIRCFARWAAASDPTIEVPPGPAAAGPPHPPDSLHLQR
jgi:integrase/recombinase XerD